jgi:serine/threonine-protein kinase
MAALAADRNLLFGLLALQIGLIDQDQLMAAFRAWSRDKDRSMADHLVGRGDLDHEQRALLEGLVAQHVKKHGGDAEKSLAALPVVHSTRESLAQVGDADVMASLVHLCPTPTQVGEAADRTASYSVGSATSNGQRFRVLRPHARGGLGAVFVALDTELHREVALKQILEEHAYDPVSRQRFLLEAEVTGGLEHPGIVPVYGLGTHGDGRPYYAMRFIRGDNLKEAIEQFHADAALKGDHGRRSLELRKLLRRFTDVCNAIDYAHSRGILHRDINPGNIIVEKHGETLIVDWGLAKPLGRAELGSASGERTLVPSSSSGSSSTLPESALGTPAYMSPEQAEGDIEHLGPRSDVYNLGATLYCVLTGKPPFEGDVADVIRGVQKGQFPPPRQLNPTIDRALEAICLKAMATRREDRYASCRSLAEDLERWMADEPVTAWTEPWTQTLLRWLTRHRTGVTGAAAAVLAGVVGLSAVLTVQTRANAQMSESLNREMAAHAALAQANKELTRSKAAVQERYDLAVDAIKTFHTGVSEDFLLGQNQFKDLRDRLLKSASDFYGKLGALLGKESDPASRRALAQATFEVAELTARVGRKEAALAAHRQVLADREALARELGSDADTQADVALSLMGVGRLLAETGRADDGLAAYTRARAVLQELADEHPAIAPYRDALARTSHYTGDLHWSVGRYADAARSHGEARAIWTELAKSHPTNIRFQDDEARSDLYCGVNLALSGRTDEALASYERARAILQRLVDVNPGVTQFQRDLANCLGHISSIKQRTGKRAEALAQRRAALAID